MSDTLVRMPRLADTLVEGTVGQWLKRVGETVLVGEPLASIETDKVTTEISSPSAGTLLEILVSEGQTVPVETIIARLGATENAPVVTPAPVGVTPAPPAPGPKPTPLAARLLAEHGLTPQQVASRPGRLTKGDVVHYLQRQPVGSSATPADASAPEEGDVVHQPQRQPLGGAPPPLTAGPTFGAPRDGPTAPVSGERVPGAGGFWPLSSMRRAIADHLLRASMTIPHGQTVVDADLTRLVAWRDLHKSAFLEAEKANLTFTVLFVHALARHLAVVTGESTDVGVAVALDAGLIVPVVRKADSLALGETARAIADLAARARAGALALQETRGAQMTVTNVGSFGNLTASPIVPLGQRGILGPGLVERRPLPAPDGGIRPGWRCRLCLMFDRREFDDFAADRFLRGVVDELDHLGVGAPVSV